jgi:hypothetical protein
MVSTLEGFQLEVYILKSLNSNLNNLKTGLPSISLRVSLLLIVCFASKGCTLIKLQKDVNMGLESTVLVGHIYTNVLGNGPIIVAACSTTKGKEIAHYTVLHDSGEYELMVGQGTY